MSCAAGQGQGAPLRSGLLLWRAPLQPVWQGRGRAAAAAAGRAQAVAGRGRACDGVPSARLRPRCLQAAGSAAPTGAWPLLLHVYFIPLS